MRFYVQAPCRFQKIIDVQSNRVIFQLFTITIQVLNSLDSSFTLFLGILSHEDREKAKLSTLGSLAKSLEDKELRMKNQDKATANYAKQFTKKKAKSPLNLPEDFQHPEPGLVTK